MILIKNLYLSKQCGARRLLSDKGWELGSIDSLLKRIRMTSTIILSTGSGRPRLVRSGRGPWVMTVSGRHTVVCDCVCVGVLWSAVRSWRYMGLSLLSALSVGVSSCLLSVPCDWGCTQADRWRTVRAHCVCAMDSRSTIWQCSVHGTYWKCLKVSTHVVMVYGGSSASVLKGAVQIHYYYYRQACA